MQFYQKTRKIVKTHVILKKPFTHSINYLPEWLSQCSLWASAVNCHRTTAC